MTVKKKRGRPTGNKPQLSSEAILSTAKALLKEQGKLPSIRGLATALEVDAMAIYHYFENKNALLEAITTSLIEEIYMPTSTLEWETELKALCASYVSLLDTYPGLLETLLTMSSTSPAEVFFERFKLVTKPLKLNDEQEKQALDLLGDYLHGFALAMNCNQDKDALNIQMLDGALALYCVALKNIRQSDYTQVTSRC